MRLPLLVAGTPKKIIKCASVRLPAGNWRVVVENQKDSILQFLRDDEKFSDREYGTGPSTDPFSYHKEDSLSVVGPATYTVCFQEKGNETDLNIYFEAA